MLAVKGARLSDFGGCSLSLINSSTLQINPDIPEAFKLRGWFDNDGKTAETTSISGQRSSGEYGITVVMVMITLLLQEECRRRGYQQVKLGSSILAMETNQTTSV